MFLRNRTRVDVITARDVGATRSVCPRVVPPNESLNPTSELWKRRLRRRMLLDSLAG